MVLETGYLGGASTSTNFDPSDQWWANTVQVRHSLTEQPDGTYSHSANQTITAFETRTFCRAQHVWEITEAGVFNANVTVRFDARVQGAGLSNRNARMVVRLLDSSGDTKAETNMESISLDSGDWESKVFEDVLAAFGSVEQGDYLVVETGIGARRNTGDSSHSVGVRSYEDDANSVGFEAEPFEAKGIDVALIVADPNHISTERAEGNLLELGYSVTVYENTNTNLDTVDWHEYDIVASSRLLDDSASFIKLREIADGGTPVWVDIWGSGTGNTTSNHPGVWMDLYQTHHRLGSQTADVQIENIIHEITDSYTQDEVVTVFESTSWRNSVVDSGDYTGTILAHQPNASARKSLVVIDEGELDLENDPVGARIVLADFLYGLNADRTEEGLELVGHAMEWLEQVDEPVEVVLEETMNASALMEDAAAFFPDVTVSPDSATASAEMPGGTVGTTPATASAEMGDHAAKISNPVEISLEEDTTVKGSFPTQNFEDDDRVDIRSNGSDSSSYTLFKFDSSSIKQGDIVEVWWLVSAGQDYDIQPYRITEDWDAGTVTWNTRPAHTTANPGGINRWYPSDEWRGFDITPIVNEWLNSATNHGVLMRYVDDNLTLPRTRAHATSQGVEAWRPFIRIWVTAQSIDIEAGTLDAAASMPESTVTAGTDVSVGAASMDASALLQSPSVSTTSAVSITTDALLAAANMGDHTVEVVNPDVTVTVDPLLADSTMEDPGVTAAQPVTVPADSMTASSLITEADIDTEFVVPAMLATASGPFIAYMESMDPYFNFINDYEYGFSARTSWFRLQSPPDSTSEIVNRKGVDEPTIHGGVANEWHTDQENLGGRQYLSFNGVDQYIDVNAFGTDYGGQFQRIGVYLNTWLNETFTSHVAYNLQIAFRTTQANTALAEDIRIENGRIVFTHPDVLGDIATGHIDRDYWRTQTRVDDGKWHFLSFDFGQPNRPARHDESQVTTDSDGNRTPQPYFECRIDGNRELFRWYSSSRRSFGRHPRTNTIGRDGDTYFLGDIAEVHLSYSLFGMASFVAPSESTVRDKHFDTEDLKEAWWAWGDATVVRATPLRATADLGQESHGRGNMLRLLMLHYTTGTSSEDSTVYSRGENYFNFVLTGVQDRLHHSMATFPRDYTRRGDDTFEWGPYLVTPVSIWQHEFRDPITWERRFIDLQEDINLDEYDAMVLMNYPITRREWGSDTRRKFDDFIESYKQAMYDGMKTIIFDPFFANKLGLVKRVDSTGIHSERHSGGHEVGRDISLLASDGQPVLLINREEPSNRPPSGMAFSDEFITDERNEWRTFDQSMINRHRIVSEVPGLTDLHTPTQHYDFQDFIDVYYGSANDNIMNFSRQAWKLVPRNELQPGDEMYPFMPISRFDGHAGAYGLGHIRPYSRGVRFRTLYWYGTAGEENVVGVPVAKGQEDYWHGGTKVPAPSKEWVSAFVVEEGTELDGKPLGARVFVTFNEGHQNNGSALSTPWTQMAISNRWPEGHNREDNSPFDFDSGRIELRTIMLQIFVNEESDRTRNVPQLQTLAAPRHTAKGHHYSLLYRGVSWLHEDDGLPEGWNNAHATAMTAHAEVTQASTSADRNINVTAHRAFRASARVVEPLEAETPDAAVFVLPAQASAKMVEPPSLVQISPMTAIATGPHIDILEDVLPEFERPVVPAYLHRPRATVYLRS